MGYGRGMTTSVTITGSGTPIPSPDRAGPGVLVQCGDVNLQFDAGRSTLMRLAAMGVWPGQLNGVFVTHHLPAQRQAFGVLEKDTSTATEKYFERYGLKGCFCLNESLLVRSGGLWPSTSCGSGLSQSALPPRDRTRISESKPVSGVLLVRRHRLPLSNVVMRTI